MAAMLKVAVDAEEELGNELMVWWDGQGAPLVLARQDKAILLERAQHGGSLADLVRNGRDDEATRIICDVVKQLHLPRSQPIPTLVPLSEWFGELWPAAETYGGPPGSALTEKGHRGEICLRRLRRNRQYTDSIGYEPPTRLGIALLPAGYQLDLKVGLRPRRELDGVRLTGREAEGCAHRPSQRALPYIQRTVNP